MSIKELVVAYRVEIKEMSKVLPLPGLTEWFLDNFWDEIEECEETTMDIVGPALSAFYPPIS